MYVYNDEDNAPMNDPFSGIHNPTVYLSRTEMQAMDNGVPFEDEPEKGCWNCKAYNGEFCTKFWNNMDECFKDTKRDLREPSDCCDDWEEDESAVWEDYFGED